MHVIIVGGGIGGLSLALSLYQAGIAVRIYESVGDLAPLGVGINLQPSAVRELTELGLAEDLERTGIPIGELSYFNKLGQLIWSERRGIAGYKWPQYSIHRGELLIVLLEAVRARLGPERIRTGHHFVAFEQDQFGVRRTQLLHLRKEGSQGVGVQRGAHRRDPILSRWLGTS